MIRSLIVIAASSLVVATASSASAQEAKGFGQKGSFIISADRLVPLFAYSNNKVTDNTQNPAASDSTTTTSFALLPNFNGGLLGNGNNNLTGNFYNVPRVGFDYAVIDRLTLGGSIAFAVQTGSSETQSQGAGSVTNDAAKATYFAIAPRIGYALPLSDLFVFWPRAGFSFNLLHISNPDRVNGNPGIVTSSSTNATQWALSLEPLFAITPVQHFGFFVGPVVDIPLAGTAKTDTTRNGQTTTTSFDLAEFHFGVTAGLLGWF
jgi:hypothetical protein